MHSAAQTCRPRSAAVASPAGLSAGPCAPIAAAAIVTTPMTPIFTCDRSIALPAFRADCNIIPGPNNRVERPFLPGRESMKHTLSCFVTVLVFVLAESGRGAQPPAPPGPDYNAYYQ